MSLTGASTIFIGVESKFAGDHGYGKTHGKSYKEMFDGLHNVGIATTGAWMVGFDFQNRQNIEEDLQDFIALEPSTQQLTRVCPFPGTPFWKEMKKEGRIRDDVRWEEISFYGGGGMAPKNFNEHEIMNIIERGYKELYETHGATMARFMDVNMRGYEYCMENRHRNKHIGDRGQLHKRVAFSLFPLLKAMEIYAPNGTVRKKMKDKRRKYVELFGEPTTFQTWMEKGMTTVAGFTKLKNVLFPIENVLSEEPFKKYIYDKPVPAYPEKPYRVERPQGGKKFDKNVQAQKTAARIMGSVQSFAAYLDRRKGVEIDQKISDSALGMFM